MSANFYAGIDCALVGSIVFKITETGGGGASATITLADRYFHQHEVDALVTGDAWLSLAIEINNALGAAGLNASYSATYIASTGLWTITASGGGVTSFAIGSLSTTALRVLGLAGPVSGALSYTSSFRSWYEIVGTEGGISEWTALYEVPGDIQTDLIAYDGSYVEGLAVPGVIKGWDLEVPWEPKEAVWSEWATAGVPWTWADWFPMMRTGVPFIVHVPGLTAAPGPSLSDGMVCFPSARKVRFAPKLLGGGYLGHASIQLGGYYLGTATI